MKKLLHIPFKILFISLFFVSFSFSEVTINAIKVPGNVSDIGPTSKAWLSTRYQYITLYPQTTLIMENEFNSQFKDISAIKVKIKAIYDGKNISILIKWRDNSKSPEEKIDPISYSDSYAVQLPVNFNDVKKLPYIGMGSRGRAVAIMLNRTTLPRCEQNRLSEFIIYNDELEQSIYGEYLEKKVKKIVSGESQKNFISQGYDNFAEIKDSSSGIKMHMIYKKGYWRGTISTPMKSKYFNINKGSFPIAFAIWYGDRANRGAIKFISSWIGISLVSNSDENKLAIELSTKPKGDVRNGKKLAKENCAACHIYANQKDAPESMAPNLSNIGGYSTKEYLLESIVDPNAVLVPGYKDNKNFSWYDIDENGKRVSTMPSYDWLDKKSLDDLVAFFMTQKAKVK